MPGQVLSHINGTPVDGTIVDIGAAIKAAGRPLALKLTPGSIDLKLAAFHFDAASVQKKGKKKSKK
eukprot:SAG11_NODE_6037_length_1405_cov_1.233538_2_plen_66_part_00